MGPGATSPPDPFVYQALLCGDIQHSARPLQTSVCFSLSKKGQREASTGHLGSNWGLPA